MFRFVCGIMIVCLSGCVSQVDKSQTQSMQNVSQRNISSPAVEIAEKEISLGVISSQQAEIKGIIPIFNPGSETLEIKKVSGPCACFKGYSGDKTIQPG